MVVRFGEKIIVLKAPGLRLDSAYLCIIRTLRYSLELAQFAGSGLLVYAMGFALKKILKWVLIIVGFLAGMFFVGVQVLQRYGYVSSVN